MVPSAIALIDSLKLMIHFDEHQENLVIGLLRLSVDDSYSQIVMSDQKKTCDAFDSAED